MKKLRVAACMLMLALAGCDNNDNAPTAVKKDAPSEVTKAASSENVSSAIFPRRSDKNWPNRVPVRR